MNQIAPDMQTSVVLFTIIGEQQDQAVGMQTQITRLEEKHKELFDRLNTNNQNSSKTPSTDGYKPTAKDSKPTDSPADEDDQFRHFTSCLPTLIMSIYSWTFWLLFYLAYC